MKLEFLIGLVLTIFPSVWFKTTLIFSKLPVSSSTRNVFYIYTLSVFTFINRRTLRFANFIFTFTLTHMIVSLHLKRSLEAASLRINVKI